MSCMWKFCVAVTNTMWTTHVACQRLCITQSVAEWNFTVTYVAYLGP